MSGKNGTNKRIKIIDKLNNEKWNIIFYIFLFFIFLFTYIDNIH